MDESGSEMGDAPSSAKLDVITKEQLFDAYRKSLDRYHKYRCRYTDLAKKYKDLERDSTKARVCFQFLNFFVFVVKTSYSFFFLTFCWGRNTERLLI